MEPVTCLGLTFESDDACRAYFTERLREHLRDPAFRAREGFPISSDEEILRLSYPPYYTACPNPFIPSYLVHHGRPYHPDEPYTKEPFATDVSEGKNDPIYNAHSYHTKVPHKAIMRYILHYTEPGDIVFDGFCGTGMTGVAAQLCGDRAAVESLGFKVLADGAILDEAGRPFARLGARHAVLNDLSPAASFIARNYNLTGDPAAFAPQAREILRELTGAFGWMYETTHVGWPADDRVNPPLQNPLAAATQMGSINYVIWSDVLACAHCGGEIIYWDAARRPQEAKVADRFDCPHCQAVNEKARCARVRHRIADPAPREVALQVPVLIDYTVGGKRYHKYPDEHDRQLLARIDAMTVPAWFPTQAVPGGFNLDQPKRSHGVAYAHDFYSRRNLIVLAALWERIGRAGFPPLLSMWFTSTQAWATRLNRLLVSNFFLKRGGVIGQTLPGTLYLSSVGIETNVLQRLALRIASVPYGANKRTAIVGCGSTTDPGALPEASVDYIFIDPPFGGNIMYSDVNFLWEAWLSVRTATRAEAILNPAQQKGLNEYRDLMERSFAAMYRALKPGRWLTVEFHNARNAVWNAIQQAMTDAGFIVADVRMLEKTHHSFKQVTAGNAVRKDLVISAYKPVGTRTEGLPLQAGTAEGVWEFVDAHLRRLSVAVPPAGGMAERMNYLLFDRMVAFHLQRGITIPLSAAAFYAGLRERFPEREGIYFLPEQAAEYDRLTCGTIP